MRSFSKCCDAPTTYRNGELICLNCDDVCEVETPGCSCGSGKEPYPLEDARGIFCQDVCEDCEEKVKSQYRPEIFTDSNYYADEPIDDY